MELYSVFFDLKAYQNQQNNYVVTSVVAVIVVRTAKKSLIFPSATCLFKVRAKLSKFDYPRDTARPSLVSWLAVCCPARIWLDCADEFRPDFTNKSGARVG